MNWDRATLVILAAFGCLTLLLTQINEVLAKVPQIIRTWRQVRDELRSGTHPGSEDRSVGVIDPSSPATDRMGTSRAPDESLAGNAES
ncbi:hypothetical protein [Kitasatospora paranensis]|uniref:Uncharacterized protein n=1 Tax=Kitasatospora paranensis TaxID=258053 RepID=A0ABW2FYI5_9ACTN